MGILEDSNTPTSGLSTSQIDVLYYNLRLDTMQYAFRTQKQIFCSLLVHKFFLTLKSLKAIFDRESSLFLPVFV